jgi:hypothetical protein
MAANNDITGDAIITAPASKAYRDNYDQIFRKDESSLPSLQEVCRNVSDIQRKIWDNIQVQEVLERLKFTIEAEIGNVKDISTNINFENGEVALIWIDKN